MTSRFSGPPAPSASPSPSSNNRPRAIGVSQDCPFRKNPIRQAVRRDLLLRTAGFQPLGGPLEDFGEETVIVENPMRLEKSQIERLDFPRLIRRQQHRRELVREGA